MANLDSRIMAFKITPGETIHVATPKQRRRRAVIRFARRWLFRPLQLVTGVHRIHHIRWGFGLKLPFSSWARFYERPRLRVISEIPLKDSPHWKRVDRRDYHDCTKTGRY